MSSASYTVLDLRPAQKEIKSLDQGVRVRILQAIRALAADPRPAGCRKLIGAQNRWRVRAGDYRIIYTVNDAGRIIETVFVRHRSKAYE